MVGACGSAHFCEQSVMAELGTTPRAMVLLNPGRQSRHYLLGLAAGAARAGVPCLTLELGPIWQGTSGPQGARAMASARAQVSALVRDHGITHVIGYVFNGMHDLGLAPGGRTLWDELGVRHILLWTDHPEWATNGAALDASMPGLLGGEHRTHILKCESAALEASEVLGWPNVRAMAMAEDYTSVRPSRSTPIHDVVAIVGDAGAPPSPTLPFLEQADPDPAQIDLAMRPHAERAWRKVVGGEHDSL